MGPNRNREKIAFREPIKQDENTYYVNIPHELLEETDFPKSDRLLVEYDEENQELVYSPA